MNDIFVAKDFETVYKVVLTHELKKRGLNADRQVPVSIDYDEIKLDEGSGQALLLKTR